MLTSEVITFGGSFGTKPLFIQTTMMEQGCMVVEIAEMSNPHCEAAKEAANEQNLSLIFLSNADN